MSATLASSTAPLANEYGGDEVSALVLDPGYTSMRAGFAGEDYPKSITPSHYGVIESPNAPPRLIIGENEIHNPLPNLDIRHPMTTNGKVEVKDPDIVKRLFEYSIVSKLVPKPSKPIRNGHDAAQDGNDGDVVMENAESSEEGFLADTPLLLTDLDYLMGKAREEHIQYVFEEWGCPAYWGGKQSVLAAFSAGRSSALVIDLGASKATVSPVVDGMALRKGVKSSPYAGNFVSNQVRSLFAKSQPPVPLTPHYLVASKTPVDAGAPAQAVLKTFRHGSPLPSFRAFEEERVITEFKECILMARPKYDQQTQNIMGKPFEMPDGWNQVFGAERTRPVEALFDASVIEPSTSFPAHQIHTLPSLILASLQSVDVDVRHNMLNNVVVVGGTSLIQGLNARLQDEILALLPGQKVRIHAPGNYAERRYASWIGGSILASLGSFHQMWVSRKEYDEVGVSALLRRLN